MDDLFLSTDALIGPISKLISCCVYYFDFLLPSFASSEQSLIFFYRNILAYIIFKNDQSYIQTSFFVTEFSTNALIQFNSLQSQ